jgi:hypothetical protein
MHSAVQQAAANSPGMQASPFAATLRSPLTLGIYFVLAGYYLCYYLNLIVRGRTLMQRQSAET